MQRSVDDGPFGGPAWPLLPASMARTEAFGDADWFAPRTVLWSRPALRWYVGSVFALLWLISPVVAIAEEGRPPADEALGIGLVVVYGLAFAAAVPLNWVLRPRFRAVVIAVVWLLSLSLVPWLGWGVASLWTYVGVVIAMSVLSWAITWWTVLGLGVVAAAFGYADSGWTDEVLYNPAIIISISMMMAAFARVIAAMNALRATQREMARLAAVEERGRVARDIHDILGHSLTVIAVKAELAGRLVDLDPERAKGEIGQVEELARGALADVRSTVSGFRGVSITGELAAARSALESAGIRADLPSTTDAVPPERRELAGWVVREGVTNVLRHSSATLCRVRVGERDVEVADDGVGPTGAPASTGLSGLRERVEAAGGRMSTGASDLGGFSLKVTT